MKTIRPLSALVSAVLILSVSAYADGRHNRGGYESPRHVKMSSYNHYNRHSGGNWVVPLVIGGVLGYALSEPRRESVTYVSSAPSPVVYTPQPVYQEQWVYFSDCDCQRKVLVPVR
ncbi:hypothetical protein [Sulfuricurvum sp.]|uniref:hypothetical protein n=1 Tax=Sulfuricurvum sp. TaxID=2025608 RepID=UPI003C317467